jgi:hypothetical protein
MDSCIDTDVFTIGGFPHSDICGSSVICTYPQLFAACHVLLRLSVPRHPPCALSSLTYVLSPSRLSNPKSNFINLPFRLHHIYIFVIRLSMYININLWLQYLLKILVGLNGIEPSTSRLSGVRSNQLSYKPTTTFD